MPCLLLAEVLQQGTSKIGIDVRLNMMPGPQRFQVILDHKPNLGIQVLGQGPDSPHPMDKPDLLYRSSKAAPGYENSANYKNAQVDRLIAQGLASSDPKVAARNALRSCSRDSRRSLHPDLLHPRCVGGEVGLVVQVVARALLLQPDVAEPPRCQVVT